MRKVSLMLAALLLLFSCEKAITIDHNISAEFPGQEQLEAVSVLLAQEGTADILVGATNVTTSLEGLVRTDLPGGVVLLRYKALALVKGNCTDADALLEATFWANPSLQWIFCLQAGSDVDSFALSGLVNCLRARGLQQGDWLLYAGSNVYDKMSGIGASPLGFTAQIREDR